MPEQKDPVEDRFDRYSRREITPTMVLAYMLQFTRRSRSPIARDYLAEKVSRAARASNEFELVSELDLANLRLYDQCKVELSRG